MDWIQIEKDFAVEFEYFPNRKRKEILDFFINTYFYY